MQTKLKFISKRLTKKAEQVYVAIMFKIISYALIVASKHDTRIKNEINLLPKDFHLIIQVNEHGPYLSLQKGQNNILAQHPTTPQQSPFLRLTCQNTHAAFLLVSAQESIPKALAQNHLAVQGDLHLSMHIIRCLKQLIILLLPKLIAKRSIKKYPKIPWWPQLYKQTRFYVHLLRHICFH